MKVRWIWLFLAGFIAGLILTALLFNPTLLTGADMPILTVFFGGKALGTRYLLSLAIGLCVPLIADTYISGDLDTPMKRVGNGQYGTARWATPAERDKAYSFVRADKATVPGIVVEYNRRGYRVDTSDQSLLLLAPPGARKTKGFYIPNIKYNADVNRNTGGNGASLLIVDSKGEEFAATGKELENSGYRVIVIDLRSPTKSYGYNPMCNVNHYIDLSAAATDESEKLRYRARAEHAAKQLSSSICRAAATYSNSESGEFFTNTSEGLVTSMILLVSEYGDTGERHIVSVFHLIIELNGLTGNSGNNGSLQQKNRLAELLERLPDGGGRIRLFSGAAVSADVRTSMNVFSSALSKLLAFLDAETEQLLCVKRNAFTSEDLVNTPTAIFLTVPDEDTTRHFIASLFLLQTIAELVSMANSSATLKLPRSLLIYWDEFGNMPPVKDLDVRFAAARSCGIRIIPALQSLAQLENKYSRNAARVIRETCQMTMFSFVAPLASDTAKALSEALGNYTVQSGSISQGDKRSTSIQMMGRALMTPDEIMAIPAGQFIVLKGGGKTAGDSIPPTKTNLPVYLDVWELPKERVNIPPLKIRPIEVLTEEKLIARQRCAAEPEQQSQEQAEVVRVPPQTPETDAPQATSAKPAASPRGFRRKETAESAH